MAQRAFFHTNMKKKKVPRNSKKIIFIPFYFYLVSPYFEQVAKLLTFNMNYFSCIIRIADHGFNYDLKFNKNYYSSKQIPFIDFLTVEKENTKIKNLNSLRKFFYRIKFYNSFIKKNRPDLIVISSDLGDIYIRLFIELCRINKVKTLIYCPVDALIDPEKNNFRKNIYMYINKILFYSNLSFLNILRAIIFNGKTIGSFSINSYIGVVSDQAKSRLILKNIEINRISVLGIPQFLLENIERNEILKKLGKDQNSILITLFTEIIEIVYGEEYVFKTYSLIADIFKSLAKNYPIIVIVKPHPREIQKMLNFYQNLFSKPPFYFSNDFSSDQLISVSDINVAHYSTVLMTSAINKKCFISINFLNDDKRRFYSLDQSKFIEAHSKDEFIDKIIKIISHSSDYRILMNIISELSENLSNNSNSNLIVKKFFEFIINK